MIVEIKAIILDRDVCYEQRLAQWMEKHDYGITFALCGTLEEAADAAGTADNTILLMADCMDVSLEDARTIGAAAHFTEHTSSEYDGEPVIRKYQRGKDIYEQIQKVIQTYQNSEAAVNRRRMAGFEVYSVCSVVDNAGLRTTASALASLCMERGKNVLVWNLDDSRTMRGYVNASVISSVGEIDVKWRKEHMFALLLEMGHRTFADADIRDCIENIKKSMCFDALIIVSQCNYPADYGTICDISSHIYMVGQTANEVVTMNRIMRMQETDKKKCSVLYNAHRVQMGVQPQSDKIETVQGSTEQVIMSFKDKIKMYMDDGRSLSE